MDTFITKRKHEINEKSENDVLQFLFQPVMLVQAVLIHLQD
jgi:hypothetical protein